MIGGNAANRIAPDRDDSACGSRPEWMMWAGSGDSQVAAIATHGSF
jgi:hypothetical protein